MKKGKQNKRNSSPAPKKSMREKMYAYFIDEMQGRMDESDNYILNAIKEKKPVDETLGPLGFFLNFIERALDDGTPSPSVVMRAWFRDCRLKGNFLADMLPYPMFMELQHEIIKDLLNESVYRNIYDNILALSHKKYDSITTAKEIEEIILLAEKYIGESYTVERDDFTKNNLLEHRLHAHQVYSAILTSYYISRIKEKLERNENDPSILQYMFYAGMYSAQAQNVFSTISDLMGTILHSEKSRKYKADAEPLLAEFRREAKIKAEDLLVDGEYETHIELAMEIYDEQKKNTRNSEAMYYFMTKISCSIFC